MNSPQPSLAWTLTLEQAIDRHPLVVSPTALLGDVVNLIGQTGDRICSLGEKDDASWGAGQPKGYGGCVLVAADQALLGIVTERDVVRLATQGIDFAQTPIAAVMISPVITLPQSSARDIFAALFLFRRYRIRHLPVVDEEQRLVGIISHESIRRSLRPANLLRLRRVADVMITEVIHAPLTATVLQAGKLMIEHQVSCIVITQKDEYGNHRPVGIVTERDIVQFQALQINMATTRVKDVMSTPLFLLSPDDSLWTAHQEMQKRHVSRLVVSWNWGQNLGIVTQTSLLKIFDPMEMYGVIENLQQTIHQLADQPVPYGSDYPKSLDTLNPITEVIAERSSDQDDPVTGAIALLQRMERSINYLISHPDLSAERRYLRCHGLLDLLKQIQALLE
ncbi:MAG: CBS domain-containing protein [Synechococcus sp.]|nr:CBS domain-containing protein [Synechococcus sp.]